MKVVYLSAATLFTALLAVGSYAASPAKTAIPSKILEASAGIVVGVPVAPLVDKLELECDDDPVLHTPADECSTEATFPTWVGYVKEIAIAVNHGRVKWFDIRYSGVHSSGYGDPDALIKVMEHEWGKPKVESRQIMTLHTKTYSWRRGAVDYSVVLNSGVNMQGAPITGFSLIVEPPAAATKGDAAQ
jgi:hypothetical protein